MNTYILDTSTLINDPRVYNQFADSLIVIPVVVLNELDKLKKGSSEVSKNARVAIRLLDELCADADLSVGVGLDNGSKLKVDTRHIDFTDLLFSNLGEPTYADTQILACACEYWRTSRDVILVSNDINLRVKAKARGIAAQASQGTKSSLNSLYSGVQVINNEEAGLELQRHGSLDPAVYGLHLNLHECVLFEADNGDGIAMGRAVSPRKIKLVKKHYPWSVAARNKEQTFAIDLIMDPGIDLVTLIGRAGTGKSLIVLATALDLVLNRHEYDKFIIYRPIQPVGNDIGYLPGSMEEKLAPWFQAVMDNFQMLFSTKNGGDWRREMEMYQKKGRIEMEAITYIRGRSIPNAIILIDECQNLSKEEVKTILTRAGDNTKIILTGDLDQIDNDDLDATNNGLIHVVENFKNSELAGHITFVRGERSRLATLASEIL